MPFNNSTSVAVLLMILSCHSPGAHHFHRSFFFIMEGNFKTFSRQISRENFCWSLWKVKRSLTAGGSCEFWWCDEIILNFTQEVCFTEQMIRPSARHMSTSSRDFSLFSSMYRYLSHLTNWRLKSCRNWLSFKLHSNQPG